MGIMDTGVKKVVLEIVCIIPIAITLMEDVVTVVTQDT